MYPHYQIAEPVVGYETQSVFTDCYVVFNMPHPETGRRYLLAKQFPTLDACTRAYRELVPDAEYIVETFLPRKNSKKSKTLWHRIPKNNTAGQAL
jgi:hypothetical protein